MKTNSEYLIREIAGESVLVPTGSASQKLNGMIRLTETAALIWKAVDTSADLAEITAKLQDAYNVDEKIAKEDVYGFLYELYRRDIVMDIPEFAAASDGESEQG